MIRAARIGFVLLILMVFATIARAEDVDRLLERFERSQGGEMVRVGNLLMDAFDQEELTDGRLEFAADVPADSLRQQVWYWAGEYYYARADYRRAIDYELKALPLFNGGTKQNNPADCMSLLSLSYFRLSDFDNALKYAMACYKLDEQSGDPDLMSSSLNTIAGIHLGANRPQEAVKYINRAIALAGQTDNLERMAVLQGMASEAHHAMGDEQKALEHIDRACALERQLGRDGKLQVRLTQRASILLGQHRWHEAEQTLTGVIPELERLGDIHSLGIAHNKMGLALYSQQRYADAVSHFRTAAGIFTQQGDLANELHARRGLYESLWSSNPDSARLELERFNALKDTLYSHATAESLARFNAQLNNDWLAQENARQQSRLKWSIMAGALAVLAISLLIWWRMRRRAHIRETALQTIIDELRQQNADQHGEATQANGSEAVSAAGTDLPDATDREFVARLVALVKKQMQQGSVSIEELASGMCITRGHLNRRVKAISGVTTQQYVTRLRLEYARQLLTDAGLSMAEVSERCGFEDTSSFSRAFKRTYGQSPTQYRTSL